MEYPDGPYPQNGVDIDVPLGMMVSTSTNPDGPPTMFHLSWTGTLRLQKKVPGERPILPVTGNFIQYPFPGTSVSGQKP